MSEGLGGYQWTAMLRDGREVKQYRDDGSERSIDEIHADGVDVVAIVMEPIKPAFAPICLDIQPGQRWIKKWTHKISVDGTMPTETCDVLGFEINGTPVYLYVYPDGVVRMSLASVP